MNDENASLLKISLFGTMRIEVNGLSLAGKCSRKELWLLALLALRLGNAVTREYLSGLLWPDSTEEQALYYLRRCLSNVRSALGEAGVCLHVIKPRSLCLDASRVRVDVAEFDRLIGREESAEIDKAIALRHGVLLEDCTENWAFQERNTREAEYCAALNRAATQAAQRSAWDEAARYARLLITVDPFEERASRTLMLALARNNDHGSAMQVYRDLRLRLRENINAAPDPETVALYETLREEARRIATPPQRLSVPVAPSPKTPLIETFAYPRALLPQPLTRLIGRESEQSELLSCLSHSRLVTLTGVGGIGKTSLCLEVARQAQSRFAHGACFVELAPLTEPERLPRLVAQALKMAEEPGVPIQDTLMQGLMGEEKLLILDNCEHILDACARLSHLLLTHCPHVRILATSRQALGLPGEVVWRVPSLPTPPETGTEAPVTRKVDSSTILEYPSVQLFLERVRQGHPTFRLTPQALPIIGQICRQLDGIPLALELAAGRVRVLPLEHIADRLNDRFRLLVGGSRAALPRQQTLRALMDWSYDLLTEAERMLLRYLSVFANGWTLEAAEAVCQTAASAKRTSPVAEIMPDAPTFDQKLSLFCGPGVIAQETIESWEVLDLLMALVEKSLVVYEETRDGARYRLLETVRQYAHEKLQYAGEEEALRCRYFDYYFRYLAERKETLQGRSQATTLRLFDNEKDNLTRALDYATDREKLRDRALEMANILQPYWRIRGYLSEGRLKLKTLLDATTEPTPARARAFNSVCTLAYFQGDYEEAWSYGNEAIALFRDLGDSPAIASALGNCANVATYLGDYETARRLNEEALAIYEQSHNRLHIAITLNGLGSLMISIGEIERAEAYLRESLVLRRELEDNLGIGVTLTFLMDVALIRNDLDTAEKLLMECERVYETMSSQRCIATINVYKGQIAACRGQYAQARQYYHEALRISRLIGDKRGYLSFLELTMRLDLEQGQYLRTGRLIGALQSHRQKIRYALSPGETEELAKIQQKLAECLGADTVRNLIEEGWTLSLEQALAFAEELAVAP